MGPKSNSGFYLSKKVVAFFTLLILALLVISTVFTILYARLRTGKAEEIFPTPWEPPGTATVPERWGPWNNSRLPSNLFPSHYQLELWPKQVPGQDGLYFLIGQANVTVMCREETEIILIHSQHLNYSGVTVTVAGSPSDAKLRPTPNIQDIWVEFENDYLVIELDGKLETGQEYIIQTNYSGHLDENLTGLFIRRYSENDKDKIIIASLLEPTYARSVFPCFDEPAMKATFDIRLVHRSQFVALSNMPAIDVSERLDVDGKWKVTTFKTSVKMSTYVTAFAICDYDYINTTFNDIEIRIWADKAAISKGEADYALNITVPILAYFEEYYNVSYPLPKLDIIALPYYGAAAMETWGLMMFRKDSLLYRPKMKFFDDDLSISIILAHELAHQWFGNLATMRWWNDLWLNEGFASYFEHLNIASIETLENLNHTYPFHLQYNVFHSETRFGSHSLSMKKEDVKTFDKIMEMFSDITYYKGASIIHMISNFMTEELFVKGLRSYLKAFSYSNAVTDDMWNHLQMAIDGQDAIKLPATIKSIMDPWATQEGVPVITVNTSNGIITQEYFGKSMENRNSNFSWFIPISWMKNGSMQPFFWLEKNLKTFSGIKRTTDEEWILLNINVSGLYRIIYDDSNWHQLILQLNKDPSVIPVSNRAQLVNDAFDLEWSGYTDIKIALGITTYLAKEQDNNVWLLAFIHLERLRSVLQTTHTYGLYKKYIFSRIVPFYHYQMKLMNEDFSNIHNSTIVRPILKETLQIVRLLDLKDFVDRATHLYSQLMSNPVNNTIPSYVRYLIYCEAIKAGTDKEWNFAWTRYLNQISIAEDEALLFGMGCSREPWILTRYLYYTLDDSMTSPDHSLLVYCSVAKNSIGWPLVWNFVRANWDTIDTNSTNYIELISLFSTLAEGHLTDFEFNEFELFLNSTTDEEGEWAKEVKHIIRDNRELLNWKKKIHTDVHNWLSENVPED
ncbi:aminopeptidase Q-like isoform X1 [Carcharodon carcharias]|uniref:aminopeptidase Q-like isoform X1 n=1 Tax=Carcharodon carcharias TaxID=13397 RepID=UPI001B7E3B68|nr:aminopeptidase Q-like isoform X1 [Carcharodon carcharias]XP_041041652.1 aminopeptidase Q-like isoform X1 [Carcharodon carcharias]XP_041041653.1 aminopeptidase Q-like isoform X1 [Carcharodon carcharias]